MERKDSDKTEIHVSETIQDLPIPPGRVWRKFDVHVLPVVSILLLLAYLDRSNIGNARVAGLQKDLQISNHQYSVALTVTYIPFMLVMIPANLLLKRVGANVLLPIITMLWGFTSMMHGFVQSYAGLLVCRFFLGVFVGGILPCITLYMSSIYPRYTLQFRISLYFSTSSFAGAFSGLLATAIVHMDGLGGKRGWSWIFILEGILTIVFGAMSFWLLPKSVADAGFLTSEEKIYVERKLREDGITAKESSDDEISWRGLLQTYQRPNVVLMMLACFLNGTTETGLAYFEPSIVQSLGYSANRAQLMSVPPFAVTFVLAIITGFLSDRHHIRSIPIIIFSLMALIGFCLFFGSDSNPVRYGSLFLSLPGCYCPVPSFAAWTANNAAPYTRRAVSLASLTIMTSAGAILSTWLLGALSPPPRYTTAAISFIVFTIVQLILVVANLVYCAWKNREKQRQRELMGESEEVKGLGDKSAWFVYSL